MTTIPSDWTKREKTPIDFIVVGAGAGGAPLAARLAERGFQVLVIEMGPGKPAPPEGAVVENTEVPLLHGETTEDKRHSLRYFVNHFGGVNEGRNPRRHQPEPDSNHATNPGDEHGVFYPRAQGLGGCTIHNAMITICGPSEDWDEIAEEMGDPSWRGEPMRAYFERMECCHYDRANWLSRIRGFFRSSANWSNGRHGHHGWLQTSMADLRLLVDEKKFFKVVTYAALESLDAGSDSLTELKAGALPGLDPNHWETMRRSLEGVSQIPVAITKDGARSSPRDRLLEVQVKHPDRLHLLTETIVTQLLFSTPAKARQPVVSGVAVLPQAHVYEADAQAARPDREWAKNVKKIFCRREVILCGGSFNTPQLLMLSGIGDKEELEAWEDIKVRKDLPAVGKNLQDRYEVPIVATVNDRFRSLDSLELSSQIDDPQLRQWRETRGLSQGTNVYATNGGLIGVFKRSSQERSIPDLFMFAAAGYFPGYHVGWSRPEAVAPDVDNEGTQDGAARHKRVLTWLVLKARSRNRSGTVKLRDTSPFRRPEIDFRILPEPLEENQDVQAMYEGVFFVEQMLRKGRERGFIESYELPFADAELSSSEVGSVDRKRRVKEWIKDVAWGHHACGTCCIGRDPKTSVIDERFRVHGVTGLRVVDASVFPTSPGYFIVTNIYMVSEKAADVISEDHHEHFDRADLPTDVAAYLLRDPIYYSRPGARARNIYPQDMESQEAKLILQRRKAGNRGEKE